LRIRPGPSVSLACYCDDQGLTISGCGHTKGKSVVSRGESYARIQAACDARDQGKDIFILARTDALMLGWEEAMTRGKEFKRIGVDAVFVEALPDRESMRRCVEEIGIPTFANSKSHISVAISLRSHESC
jgi:2-methylisocitrate lyase-like PEP mutase family enzyme